MKILFTNVLLENTINIILKRIYVNKEIKTTIPKEELRKPLYLCTKLVQFTFNDQFYTEVDGVAMGPVLANIFMVELEKTILFPRCHKSRFGIVVLMIRCVQLRTVR